MAKERVFHIRLTEEQYAILEEKTASSGFTKKAEYIRTKLFAEE
jgi:hypothetical protein